MCISLTLTARASNSILLSVLFLVSLIIARLIQNHSRSSFCTAAKPAHWSCKYSSLWIRLQRLRQQDSLAVHKAHLRYGVFVRLAPNEISICDLDSGLKPIYEGRLPKTDWYDIWTSYGEEPMFAMKDEERHSGRRRLLAKPYFKSSILGNGVWLAKQRELAADLRATVKGLAGQRPDVELYDLSFAWAVATISTFVYGSNCGLNLLRDLVRARELRLKDAAERSKQAWGTTLSFLPRTCLRYLGISAQVGWMQDIQRRAEEIHETEQASTVSVYSYMISSIRLIDDTILDARGTERVIASELQDHMVAGIDTSTTTLATCTWLLSCPENQKWQDCLRNESQDFRDFIDAAKIESLPILDAIVKESLRLMPPVAGCQPRMTTQPLVLGSGVTVPSNTIVHSQAWSLHRNPEVFEEPEQWLPERWLDCSPERKQKMNAWFWAFGSGSRRCLGENLAMSSLKLALVTIYGSFETTVTENTKFTLGHGNLALPVPDKDGKFLRLRIDEAI